MEVSSKRMEEETWDGDAGIYRWVLFKAMQRDVTEF